MLLEHIERLLHLLNLQLNTQCRRLNRINRAHHNLKIRQLLNVSIEIKTKFLIKQKDKDVDGWDDMCAVLGRERERKALASFNAKHVY
jgi:hypothetical protein